jgi:hypothetical protein
VARDSLHDVTRWAELAELELLGHLGADVVVTIDRTILSLRNHALLRGLNVMTPEEAFVLVGVWSRVVHNAFCEGAVGYNNGLYYAGPNWAVRTFEAAVVDFELLRGHREALIRTGRTVLDGHDWLRRG